MLVKLETESIVMSVANAQSIRKEEVPSVSSKSSAGNFRFTGVSAAPSGAPGASSSHNDPNPCVTAPENSSSPRRSPKELFIREETGDTGMLMDFCIGLRQGCEKVS